MRFDNYLLNEAIKRTPIVYHGSYNKDIKSFYIKKRLTETGAKHFGAYFTDSIEVAKTFGDYIYKAQLTFKKIIDMTKWKPRQANEDFLMSVPELRPKEQEYYLKFEYRGKDSPYHMIENLDDKYNLLPRWKRKGYDGIAFWEEHFSKKGITYIPFYSNQIKILEIIE